MIYLLSEKKPDICSVFFFYSGKIYFVFNSQYVMKFILQIFKSTYEIAVIVRRNELKSNAEEEGKMQNDVNNL